MNLKEWKEKHRKTISLKSGLEVTVRRLPGFIIGGFGHLPQLEDIEDQEQVKMVKNILTTGLISPKLGEGPDELSLLDLTIDDINEIVEAIISISGVTATSPLADPAGPEVQPPS